MERGLKIRVFFLVVTLIALVLAISYRDADLGKLGEMFEEVKRSVEESSKSNSSSSNEAVTELVSFAGMKADVLLDEHFANNKNRWYLGSEDKGTCTIADSSYNLAYSGNQSFLIWLPVAYMDADTISIHQEIEVVAGSKSHSFGPIWNTGDINNVNYFVINQRGAYSLSAYDSDDSNPGVLEGDISNQVVSDNPVYVIELRKAGTTMDILVNGKIVLAGVSAGTFYGNGVGFMVIDDLSIRVKRVTVTRYVK